MQSVGIRYQDRAPAGSACRRLHQVSALHTPAHTPALSVSHTWHCVYPAVGTILRYSMVPALSALEKVLYNDGLGNKPRL